MNKNTCNSGVLFDFERMHHQRRLIRFESADMEVSTVRELRDGRHVSCESSISLNFAHHDTFKSCGP